MQWIDDALKQWDKDIKDLIDEYFPDAKSVEIFYSEDQQYCMVHVHISNTFEFIMRYPQVAAGFVSCPIWAFFDLQAYYFEPFMYPDLRDALNAIASRDHTIMQAKMQECVNFYKQFTQEGIKWGNTT